MFYENEHIQHERKFRLSILKTCIHKFRRKYKIIRFSLFLCQVYKGNRFGKTIFEMSYK